jgi:ClpP class serine protease
VTDRRFTPTGLLAMDPRAFGVVMSMPTAPTREVRRVGQAAVVSIVGPLEHHKGEGYCDSYEDLNRRFAEAFDSDAEAVVLEVDSPGGLVHGCFAAALGLRARREASGKPLYAFVTGSASSAAYALTIQADHIVIAPGASVGSIGIIDARLDATKQDAALGLQYAFVVSGERKAYGNPHLPLTEEELAVRQAAVDANASVFFDLVAARRPTTPEKLKALQAGILTGSAAIENGLADAVGSFEGLLAMVAGEPQPPARASTKEEPIMSARKALEEAAKGDGEEAAKAKRALAAWDEDEKKAEGDEPKKEEPKKEEAKKAEGDEPKDEPKKEEAKASASAAPAAIVTPSQLKAIEDEQRRAFLDTRPDLTAEQRAAVADLPMDKVRAIVNAIPKAGRPNHAATAAVQATRAEGQDGSGAASRLPPAEKQALDQRMGLSASIRRPRSSRSGFPLP